jgi:galactokinase
MTLLAKFNSPQDSVRRGKFFMQNVQEVLVKFDSRFHCQAQLYRAPGRVNLIGEHTDYNDGFVLPAAIEFFCWIAIAPRGDRRLVIYSENYNESIDVDLDDLKPRGSGNWTDYPVGVAWALEHAGHLLQGCNLYIAGEVPLGAGLSSSAALEVCTGFALMDVANTKVDLKQLALLCQRAENEFVGARCGIMDQFASCQGLSSCALLLDCRSLGFETIQLPSDVELVICNTMVRHEIGSGEYNDRRAECEEAVRRLAIVCPEVHALRDMSLDELQSHRAVLTERMYKRCHHVVSENSRTLAAAEAFKKGEIHKLRKLMADSHCSLRDDYEVSCKELDVMVQLAMQQPGVLGARMTGGGFGGCTINLVRSAESEEFCRSVAGGYKTATGYRPDIYVSKASNGAERVDL